MLPASGSNYYRLLQSDIDGRSSYSNVVKLVFGEINTSVKIMNNPVVNGQLQVLTNKALYINILNTKGQLLLSKQLNAGVQSIDVSSFASGIYMLQTTNETLKFIKK